MKINLIKSLLSQHVENLPKINYATIRNPELRDQVIEQLDNISIFTQYLKEIVKESILP